MGDLKQKYGPWAVVSGASAGLGEEFARQLAGQGLNLVLIARREDRLQSLGAALQQEFGIEYRCVAVDLGREDLLEPIQAATADLEIGLLINNAGFTNSGEFLDNSLEQELLLLHVNCRAAMVLAHHFGQAMRERRRGGMIFSASIAGFAGIPYWGHYSASKAYDLILAEALGGELARHGVDVMALCPGATRTEFEDYKGPVAALMAMNADTVVSQALRKLGKRRTTVAGLLNLVNVLATRLLPRPLNSWLFGVVVRDMVKH